MDLSQANRLAEMALDMTEQPDLPRTLSRIVSNAQLGIACDAVSLLLVRDGGKVETAVATAPSVRRADELQFECAEGPCVGGDPSEDIYVIEDTAADQRWPVWGPQVAQLGWRAVLSARFFTPVPTLGALNLYSHDLKAFREDDVAFGQIFCGHAAIALTGAQYGTTLRAAISSRHVIGQAQGILMERYQVDAERVFTVLRRYSQDKNIQAEGDRGAGDLHPSSARLTGAATRTLSFPQLARCAFAAPAPVNSRGSLGDSRAERLLARAGRWRRTVLSAISAVGDRDDDDLRWSTVSTAGSISPMLSFSSAKVFRNQRETCI